MENIRRVIAIGVSVYSFRSEQVLCNPFMCEMMENIRRVIAIGVSVYSFRSEQVTYCSCHSLEVPLGQPCIKNITHDYAQI